MIRNLKNRIKGEKFLSRNDSSGYFSGQDSPSQLKTETEKGIYLKFKKKSETISEFFQCFYIKEGLSSKRKDYFDYFSKKQADENEKIKSSYSSVSRVIEEPKETKSPFDRFFPRNRIRFKSIVFSLSRSFIL